MELIKEKNGYKLRDYVVCKWAKNKEVMGIILKFEEDDKVSVELLISDKKSPVVQKEIHTFDMEDIKPRDSFTLQYGIGEEDKA